MDWSPITNTDHPAPRTPIWLDCDTGHDDAFAILLAARSPAASLLGISTVYGNAPLESTTYNTRAILKSIGREDIPVYPGAAKPSLRDAAHAPDIHGDSGLGGTHSLPQPTVPARSGGALTAMYRALRAERPGTAWLVAVGALTNVAALFRSYPDLIDHVAGLSIMGGAVGGGFTDAPMGAVDGEGERFGNHTPFAEFNIYCDPEAARAVLSHPKLAAKTVLIPLDLTHQFLATSAVQMTLLFGPNQSLYPEQTMADVSPVRRLFFEIITFFAKTYADVFGLKAGPPVHDPLAIAATFRPDLFFSALHPHIHGDQRQRFKVTVVTDGEHGSSTQIRNGPSQCGRTVIEPVPPGQSGVLVPRALDAPGIWAMIEACLSHVDRDVETKERTSQSLTGHDELEAEIKQEMSSDPNTLVAGSETTLSQFEVARGIPDVRTQGSLDTPAKFLRTNQASQSNAAPLSFASPSPDSTAAEIRHRVVSLMEKDRRL